MHYANKGGKRVLIPDRLRMMTKQQLIHQTKSYEEQIEQQKEMPESARLDYLFGGSTVKNLKIAKEELARRS
jgi:hypothetical protein